MFGSMAKSGLGPYAKAQAEFDKLEKKIQQQLSPNAAEVQALIDEASDEETPPEKVLTNLVFLLKYTVKEPDGPKNTIITVKELLDHEFGSVNWRPIIIEILRDPRKITSLVEILNSLYETAHSNNFCSLQHAFVWDGYFICAPDTMQYLFIEISQFIGDFDTSAKIFFSLSPQLQAELFVHQEEIEMLIKEGNISFDFFLEMPDLIRIELLLIVLYSRKEERTRLLQNCAKSANLGKIWELENSSDLKDSTSYYQWLPREVKENVEQLVGLPQSHLASAPSASYKNSFLLYERLFLEIGVSPHDFVTHILTQTHIIEEIKTEYELNNAVWVVEALMGSKLEIEQAVKNQVFSKATQWVELLQTPVRNFELLIKIISLEEAFQLESALGCRLLGKESSECVIKLLGLISVKRLSQLRPDVKTELFAHAGVVQPFLQRNEDIFQKISDEMKILVLNNLVPIAETKIALWLLFEDEHGKSLNVQSSSQLVENYSKIKQFRDKISRFLPESNRGVSIIINMLNSTLTKNEGTDLKRLLDELEKIDLNEIASRLGTLADPENIWDIALKRIKTRKNSEENSTVLGWQFFPSNNTVGSGGRMGAPADKTPSNTI